MPVRIVRAVAMVAGLALLLLGVAEAVSRSAHRSDERERTIELAARVATARFDARLASTATALALANASQVDLDELHRSLDLTVCAVDGTGSSCRGSEAAALGTPVAQQAVAHATDTALAAADASMPVAPSAVAVENSVVIAVGTDRGRVLAAVVPAGIGSGMAGARLQVVATGSAGPAGSTELETPLLNGVAVVDVHAQVAEAADVPGVSTGEWALTVFQLLAGLVLLLTPIIGFVRQERGLVQRATIDGLTGLPNRAEFERAAAAALARGSREGIAASLLLVDLDDFKIVNDTEGHAAGDSVLRAVATSLRAGVRDSDLVGRWGGDEFVVLLVGVSDPRIVDQRADALARRVAAIGSPSGRGVSASIGTALAGPEDDLVALVERADRSMYAAKVAREPQPARLAR